MWINRLFSLFCFLLVIGTISPVSASEKPEIERGEAAEPPRWDASIEATWLPGSGLDGNGGNLSMEEIKAGFGRRFGITSRLEISTGLEYSLLHIRAPDAARLPESLHAVSVSVAGQYRLTEHLALALKIAPGLGSDFKVIDKDDIRVKVALLARYQMFARLTIIGGVACKAGDHKYKIRPIAGALYQPSERWTFGLGFPRTAVVFSPRKGTELFIEGEFSGNEYHLHDASLGADTISYDDYRVVAGVEFPLSRSVKLGISGGYAFAREFDFDDGNREDVEVDGAPFGRMEIRFAW